MPTFQQLKTFELIDFRVRMLDSQQGTDATARVMIDTTDGERTWTTVGVAPNLVHASWLALVDSFTFGLLYPDTTTASMSYPAKAM